MRNQQIFEANSGLASKFAFYASIFQCLKPKLASNLRPFLASKIGSVSTVFKRALGLFCVCAHGAHRKLAKLDAQGLVLNDGLLASDSTHPATKLETHLAQPTL